jgi:hypothetical protein
MSGEREEPCRLIQELPEDDAPAVLGAVQSPPPYRKEPDVAASLVRSRPGSDRDVAARSEELLRDGFGQP